MAAYLRETYGHQLSSYYPVDSLEEFVREGLIDHNAQRLAKLLRITVVSIGHLREYASFYGLRQPANGSSAR